MKRILILCLIFISSTVSQLTMALTPEEVQKYLIQVRPELAIQTVKESPLAGIYEVKLAGGHLLYVNDKATHLFAGDLYQITPVGMINLTEVTRNGKRRDVIAALDENELLVYSPAPEDVKATITIFTDIDCGYCRKLHQEVPELNKLGIAVRYMAYPRSGLNTPSYFKAVSAWCADDPNQALTDAKAGKPIPQKECDNPVARQYQLGNELGVTGTPAVLYEDGTLQPGYLPAQQTAKRLGLL